MTIGSAGVKNVCDIFKINEVFPKSIKKHKLTTHADIFQK